MPSAKSAASMEDTNGFDEEEVRTKQTVGSPLAGENISSKVYGNAEGTDIVRRCFFSNTTLKVGGEDFPS